MASLTNTIANHLASSIASTLYEKWNETKEGLVLQLASHALGHEVTLAEAKEELVEVETKCSTLSSIFQQVMDHHEELKEFADKTCLGSQRTIFGFSLVDSAAWVGAIGFGVSASFFNGEGDQTSNNTAYKVLSLALFVVSQISAKFSQYSSSKKTKNLQIIQRQMAHSFEVIKERDVLFALQDMTQKSRQLLFRRDIEADSEQMIAQWRVLRDQLKERLDIQVKDTDSLRAVGSAESLAEVSVV